MAEAGHGTGVKWLGFDAVFHAEAGAFDDDGVAVVEEAV